MACFYNIIVATDFSLLEIHMFWRFNPSRQLSSLLWDRIYNEFVALNHKIANPPFYNFYLTLPQVCRYYNLMVAADFIFFGILTFFFEKSNFQEVPSQ